MLALKETRRACRGKTLQHVRRPKVFSSIYKYCRPPTNLEMRATKSGLIRSRRCGPSHISVRMQNEVCTNARRRYSYLAPRRFGDQSCFSQVLVRDMKAICLAICLRSWLRSRVTIHVCLLPGRRTRGLRRPRGGGGLARPYFIQSHAAWRRLHVL